MEFQHPCTSVNAVRSRDINPGAGTTRPPQFASSFNCASSIDGPMPAEISRHPWFPSTFSSLELASFFAHLQAAIGVSLFRPSSCFFRVWLRFFLFLFRVRVCVTRPAELPPVIVPTFGISKYFDKSLSFAAATESRTTGAMVFLAPIVAMASPRRRPHRASLLFPHPSFQRTAATGVDTLPV